MYFFGSSLLDTGEIFSAWQRKTIAVYKIPPRNNLFSLGGILV